MENKSKFNTLPHALTLKEVRKRIGELNQTIEESRVFKEVSDNEQEEALEKIMELRKMA